MAVAHQADFYLLAARPGVAVSFCVAFCQQRLAAGQTVHVRCEDVVQAQTLDEQLWSARPTSFLPHCLANGYALDLSRYPVVLTTDGQVVPADILLNLADHPPAMQDDLPSRIVEVLSSSEARANARLRYRAYRDMGYRLQTHHLD